MVFAIIDTNVLVSYFMSKDCSPPAWVVRNALGGKITPIFSKKKLCILEIIASAQLSILLIAKNRFYAISE